MTLLYFNKGIRDYDRIKLVRQGLRDSKSTPAGPFVTTSEELILKRRKRL